jgi:hypothetical protein
MLHARVSLKEQLQTCLSGLRIPWLEHASTEGPWHRGLLGFPWIFPSWLPGPAREGAVRKVAVPNPHPPHTVCQGFVKRVYPKLDEIVRCWEVPHMPFQLSQCIDSLEKTPRLKKGIGNRHLWV